MTVGSIQYKSTKTGYEQGSDWTVISFAFNRYPLTFLLERPILRMGFFINIINFEEKIYDTVN